MVAVGFAWLIGGGLLSIDDPTAAGVGLLFISLYIVVFGHLVLAFPTGELGSRLARIVVVLGYIDVTIVQWVTTLFEPRPDCDDCAANGLVVWPSQRTAGALSTFAQAFGALLSLIAVGIIVQRFRAASVPWRRAFAPVLWAGGAAFLVLVLLLINDGLGEPLGGWIQWWFWALFAATPIAFLTGLARTRFARSALAPLVMELRDARGAADVRSALARALRDPSLAVAYWLPDEERYVGADGRSYPLPDPRSERVARVVEHCLLSRKGSTTLTAGYTEIAEGREG